MIRFISIAAAALAISGVAQAQSVTVHVAGKDANTLHREILTAANQVCADEIGPTPLAHYMMPGCVEKTVARAENELARSTVASAAAQGHDVSAVASR